jgi:RNA polymerase sigma-70 factor (ECF subfamily)
MSEYKAFPATHWSLVRRAGHGADGEASREALGILLMRYAPALRSYLRVVKRMSPGEAEEVVQAFIADRLIPGELIRQAEVDRGRFRTLLLTALNHFAVSRWRAERLRQADGEAAAADAVANAASPAAEVEATWARALVKQVIQSMRQECILTGRSDVWAVFEGRVLADVYGTVDGNAASEPASYEDLAARLGLKSPAQAANLLVTGKRMYARLLRTAVAEYERDEVDVDAEIADLRIILSRGAHRE